jgi:hypothetical protein
MGSRADVSGNPEDVSGLEWERGLLWRSSH